MGITGERRVESVDRVEQLKEKRRDYLRKVLRALSLAPMSALAEKVGRTPSALANIQNAKRSASPALIEKFRRLAPQVEGSEILSKEAMDNLVEPISEAHLTIGQRLDRDYAGRNERLRSSKEDIKDVLHKFKAMDENDVFIYISAKTPPLEMAPKEKELTKAIAKAIQKRAFFLYLLPTKEYLRSVGEYVDFSTLFVDFKSEVLSNISDESVRAQCHQRLLLIQTDQNSLFVLPDFKWELFHSNTIDVDHKAAAGALVVCGQISSDQGPRVPISLPPTSTKRILFEIAETICLVNPGLRASDRVPDDIVARLKESAELAMGQKIDLGQPFAHSRSSRVSRS